MMNLLQIKSDENAASSENKFTKISFESWKTNEIDEKDELLNPAFLAYQ